MVLFCTKSHGSVKSIVSGNGVGFALRTNFIALIINMNVKNLRARMKTAALGQNEKLKKTTLFLGHRVLIPLLSLCWRLLSLSSKLSGTLSRLRSLSLVSGKSCRSIPTAASTEESLQLQLQLLCQKLVGRERDLY